MTKKEAVALFGSQAELARALGLSRQAVSKWGDKLPPLRVYQIKELKEKKEEI